MKEGIRRINVRKKIGKNKEEELIFNGSFNFYINFISTFNQSLTLEKLHSTVSSMKRFSVAIILFHSQQEC